MSNILFDKEAFKSSVKNNVSAAEIANMKAQKK